MIIFSTKFYVNKELTMEKFIELAFDWVNGSPHYGLVIKQSCLSFATSIPM